MALRCLYVDLDRTLLGRGGSLFHDGDGAFTTLGARAIERCLQAGVEVVIVTGRSRERVRDHALTFGQRAYVFEAGAGLVVDDEKYWQTGDLSHRPGLTVHEEIARRRVPELLVDHFPGQLAYPERTNAGRRVTHVFRGRIDLAEAHALLARHGHDDLQLIDNGRREDDGHVYHLAPLGTGKGAGVLRHRELRGYAREECIAVGDSREDLGIAPQVGTFWLVANALVIDPSLAAIARAQRNVRITEREFGAGVHEAVTTALAAGSAVPA
jgi:hydroxymethylpyrimidine pyrophosphatase-like HAD family hydrolase